MRTLKICTRCHIAKRPDFFTKNYYKNEGVITVCKLCRHEQAKAREASNAAFNINEYLMKWRRTCEN